MTTENNEGCDWRPEDNSPDAAPMAFGPRCGRPANFTTCDPCGGKVCEEHQCRCSKPIDSPIWKELDHIAEQLVPMGKPLSDALKAWREIPSADRWRVLGALEAAWRPDDVRRVFMIAEALLEAAAPTVKEPPL